MSGPRLLYTLVAAGSAACNADAPSAVRADAPAAIALRGADGAQVMAVQLAADGSSCRVGFAGGEATVARRGERTEMVGASASLALEAGPAGLHVVDGSGAELARVHAGGDPVALDLLAPDGIAIARVRSDSGGAALLLDRASAPVARVARDGGRYVATAAGGAVVAYVQGPADLAVAAILSASSIDATQRGLLACNRLLTTTAAPVQ
jgi:hypothetical protein